MKGFTRRSGRSEAVVLDSISSVLAQLGPALRIEHCSLEVGEFVPATGLLTVRIRGECPDCQVSPATFSTAIAAHVKMRVPEV
ncbi:MAG TPA: NifU family protein, partial [Gemmatimonadaceae bacterium]|nr:NifU family protein [Gemmatimonadaceae bacterium]